MVELIYKDEVFKIIGTAMEVHKELGNGFFEAVYQEAFELELKNQNIPFSREEEIAIYYKSQKLRKRYRIDFICFDTIIVELKALTDLTTENEAQVLNYLKASTYKVGVLINFGTKSLQYKRFVY